MKPSSMMIALALLTAAPVLAADSKQPEAMSMNAAEIKWGDAPPDLPKGAQIAVLHGDPSKKAEFTIRLKMPAGYKIPAHHHPTDEYVTVISGDLTMPAVEYGGGVSGTRADSDQIPLGYKGEHVKGPYWDATKYVHSLEVVRKFRDAIGLSNEPAAPAMVPAGAH